MNVHRTPFACTLLILIACALFPKVATAQYTMAQCVSVTNQITKAINEQSFKKLISLARQSLTYCKEYKQRDEYVGDLSVLALGLNADNQPGEALGVANRCLTINANELTCLLEKVNALTTLGRVSEAKSLADHALMLGAITELDAAAKRALERMELRLTALTRADVSSPLPANQNPSSRAEVPLNKDGGIFVVPVQINGAITLDFAIDSGAADVTVPADVFSTLTRTGTITPADITGEQTYVLANGTNTKSVTFTIRSLRVGDKVVENVRGSVATAQGALLLGQSFLERFKSWSFDNTTHQLRLETQ